ncbi:MAG: aspartate ammonia-lyase [Elusimicrobia bacterium RIFCSPLOWO2_01_FULL_64_13]|nr:MAG: aspartate ammonia-lyase [Elusimicrobia bacterium RIFCSPHIGHO2_01_FULL_64_10]OGR94276.1 MAG: aspartate ammonia-lyase [Elusimicrobia bacterium RIFCSPLOWO2_01_FULL_64_13]
MAKTRTEKDSLGTKEVPEEAYWGIQTQRAVENFPISGIRPHPRFTESFVMVKKAAALANMELGLLKKETGQAVTRAADEILGGKLRDQFVVDVYQMGAGTSFHMNVNEVLANRAAELLGGKRGDYALCNPNDHVNMGQSTNDAFPTAMRVCGRLLLEEFIPVLAGLEKALAAKAGEFDPILKSARTHLQDAVPIRLGQEFAAYAATVGKCRDRVRAVAALLEELGIGGSAAGTGMNTHPDYRARVCGHLAKWTAVPFRCAPDMREAMQSNFPVSTTAAVLKLTALELGRIANDFRLLCSGPLTGLAEITLPAVQPGSSIMPGKVNPSMAEMLNMVCFQVIGNELTVSLAAQAGQLELNVMMPVMAHNLNTSIEIFKNAVREFTERCVKGVTADADRCRHYAEISPSLATALNARLGYARAAEVVKKALKEKKTISQVVLEEKLLTAEEMTKVLDPKALTEPGIPGAKP